MKKVIKGLAILAVSSIAVCVIPPNAVYADRTAPRDETATSDRLAQVEAELERLRAENEARARREEEQRKKAEAAKKREAELRAREARARAERERKAAEEKAFSDALNRGAQFVLDGRYHDGLKALRDFVKAHPYSADGWYWISLAHHALGDYDRAQSAVSIALEIDPYYPQLTKTPSGLEPRDLRGRNSRKEPRPLMSVLPVKPVIPENLAITPVTISFPVLRYGVRGDGETKPSSYDGRDPVSGAYLEYLPYPPNEPGKTGRWQSDEKFTEISRWRFRVDRMGLLKDPKTPIAWRSAYPYEIYFWTGTEWARARRHKVYYDHRESFADTLAQAQEHIRNVLDQRGFVWNDADTAALTASATHMNYKWMGEVDTEPAHQRADKRAREHFIYDSWDAVSHDIYGYDNEDDHDGGRVESSGPSSPERADDLYY